MDDQVRTDLESVIDETIDEFVHALTDERITGYDEVKTSHVIGFVEGLFLATAHEDDWEEEKIVEVMNTIREHLRQREPDLEDKLQAATDQHTTANLTGTGTRIFDP